MMRDPGRFVPQNDSTYLTGSILGLSLLAGEAERAWERVELHYTDVSRQSPAVLEVRRDLTGTVVRAREVRRSQWLAWLTASTRRRRLTLQGGRH
jgi:hypothetical protein